MTKIFSPIFLVSVPRSGSTFLQKILMSHPEIASAAEAWFMLPLCHIKIKKGVFAKYGHTQAVNALMRIEKDCGESSIDAQIADFAMSIYSNYTTNGERYFLDKTPRYYHILHDLIRIFPHAKFIVLTRNPISVFASSILGLRQSSARRLDHLDEDFYQGPEKISQFVNTHRKQVCLIRYEDLISSAENTVKVICEYLEVDYCKTMINQSFSTKLLGHGDHLGARKYKQVTDTTNKWKKTVNTRYRKFRLIWMLKNYSASYLELGNYDRKALLDEIRMHRVCRFPVMECLYAVEEIALRICKNILRGKHVH